MKNQILSCIYRYYFLTFFFFSISELSGFRELVILVIFIDEKF